MTKEQKELTRTYILAEVSKYIYDNKKRFAQEIETKYGFSPDDGTLATTEDDNKEEQNDRDTSPAASDDTTASDGKEE